MRSIFHHKGMATELSSSAWLQTIKSYPFSAVIFDCDGTLIESADAHFKCMEAAALDQGYHMPKAWYHSRAGLDRTNLFTAFLEDFAPGLDIRRACKVSMDAYADFAYLAEPISSSISLLLELKSRMPIAVATNSERQVAERSLDTIKISDQVDALVSISDCNEPKPAPDLFLLAAQQLQVTPERSIVIEDSPQGVCAAMKAGMSVIHINQQYDL